MTEVVDAVDVAVEIFGGLVDNVAPADLPHGVSPDCADVAFTVGSVKTRPGVTALYTLAGSASIQYMKSWENLQEIPRFLCLDSLGNLWRDSFPGGALQLIKSGIILGSFCRSDSLFGREYFAFGNGENGQDIPRQYAESPDMPMGYGFDRISQVGPGAPPSVQDYGTVSNIVVTPGAGLQPNSFVVVELNTSADGLYIYANIGNNGFQFNKVGDTVAIAGNVDGYNQTCTIIGITDQFHGVLSNANGVLATSTNGNFVTNCVTVYLTANLPYALEEGTMVTIAAATDPTYDGTNPVRENFAVNTFLVYIPGNSGVNSDSGTMTVVGNIPAGKHRVSVIFVTRNGYYTKPAPPSYWTAGGSKTAAVTQIPTGPPNVIARIVCFTAVNQASFYHLGPLGLTIPNSSMYIADNTTTSALVDFSDTVLLLGTLDDPLFLQIELPPVAGIIGYSNRLLAWGEQANLQSFINLTFDGGFSIPNPGPPAAVFPLGWTKDATSGDGGNSAIASGDAVVFGDAYVIKGDGVTAIRGLITQSAAKNYLGNPILLPNTSYGVRARFLFHGTGTGTVHIDLQSVKGAFTTPGLARSAAVLTASYVDFSATLTVGMNTVPDDLLLRVYVDGTPDNGATFGIDNIEIYPLNEQFNNSVFRASKGQLATQGQESFDSETGKIEYNLNDGQSARSAFKIRERLYLVKEHSFGVTQDDTQEPSFWTVNDISKSVGTPSVNGVGVGEDWVVIAHRTGLYLYWGGEVLNIAAEIQNTWDSINWLYGWKISVVVDTRKRRIFVTAPFGTATVPNKTLVLDYHDVGADAEAIAANPPIHLTYTGNKKAFDRARKWCPWNIMASSIAQIELPGGQTAIYFGSNDSTGRINVLDETGTIFTDNHATIASYYTMAFFVEELQEQALQLGGHRKLFTYLTMYCQGTGQLGVTAYLDSLLNGVVLNPQTLSNPSFHDIEMGLDQRIERMAIKFSSSGNNQSFDLQRCTISVKKEPWASVRASN